MSHLVAKPPAGITYIYEWLHFKKKCSGFKFQIWGLGIFPSPKVCSCSQFTFQVRELIRKKERVTVSDAHIIIMWDVVSFDIFNRAHWKSVESELRPGEVEIKSFQLTPENVVSCCPHDVIRRWWMTRSTSKERYQTHFTSQILSFLST